MIKMKAVSVMVERASAGVSAAFAKVTRPLTVEALAAGHNDEHIAHSGARDKIHIATPYAHC